MKFEEVEKHDLLISKRWKDGYFGAYVKDKMKDVLLLWILSKSNNSTILTKSVMMTKDYFLDPRTVFSETIKDNNYRKFLKIILEDNITIKKGE